MTESLERPKFLTSFFTAMAERAESKTLWRVFVAPVVLGSVGAAAAYYMPVVLWTEEYWAIASTVYVGVLTLNGLILALSWNAFSRIYESISAGKFCSFLRRNNLLSKYVVTISSINACQIFAVVVSGSGLIVLLINIPYIIVDQILFGVIVFASLYSIYQASCAVGIMNDLLWQKSIFDEHTDNSSGSTVVPIGNREP